MKLEHLLQLAEWLAQGIALALALCPVDSVNDRTLWPIPKGDWHVGNGLGTFKGSDRKF